MAEKIKYEKSSNNIKEDLIDLKLRSYIVDGSNDDLSKEITKAFDLEKAGSGILKGKTVPYFYSEFLDVFSDLYNNVAVLKDYFRTIKYDVRMALDIPEILQTLEDFIDVLDRPQDDNKKKLLPRYKKMKRLESFYEILVRFTLTILHNFFWKDITLGVDKGAVTKNLSYRIKQILPMMIKIKHDFEDEIDKEFPRDKYEQEFFTKIRNK